MRTSLLITVAVTFCFGCSVLKSKPCAKEFMQKGKFVLLNEGKLEDNYFVIKDSIHYEYLDGKLYGVSFIKWSSCNEYKMIVKEVYYKEPVLGVGDTLSVKIQSIKGDTLACIATAVNRSVPLKFLKIN